MVFYHRLSVLWLRVRRRWCGICEVDPRYYAISWAVLPVACPTVWCHMSLLLVLVHMETVRFIVFVDTKYFTLDCIHFRCEPWCDSFVCFVEIVHAICVVISGLYHHVWCILDTDMRHRSTLHVRSGQVVLPFLLGYQLVKGEMGCLLLDYDLVWWGYEYL